MGWGGAFILLAGATAAALAFVDSRVVSAQEFIPLSAERERALKPGQRFKECKDCPEMVVIPAGQFRMGSPEDESGRHHEEGPVHSVRIGAPFAVGRTEVTLEQFAAFIDDSGHPIGQQCGTFEYSSVISDYEFADRRRSFLNPSFAQEPSHPVVCVSWDDARSYVAWLSERTGRNYRLLSESEWEYSARGNEKAAFHFGADGNALCKYDNVADRTAQELTKNSDWRVAECDDGYSFTSPVGSFPANAFGLHDIHGNVGEWVEDCDNGDYTGAPSDGRAWTSGSCERRIKRGGSWFSVPKNARAALRLADAPDRRDSLSGFRVARSLAGANAGRLSAPSGERIVSISARNLRARMYEKGKSSERWVPSKFLNGVYDGMARHIELAADSSGYKQNIAEFLCDKDKGAVGEYHVLFKPGETHKGSFKCVEKVSGDIPSLSGNALRKTTKTSEATYTTRMDVAWPVLTFETRVNGVVSSSSGREREATKTKIQIVDKFAVRVEGDWCEIVSIDAAIDKETALGDRVLLSRWTVGETSAATICATEYAAPGEVPLAGNRIVHSDGRMAFTLPAKMQFKQESLRSKRGEPYTSFNWRFALDPAFGSVGFTELPQSEEWKDPEETIRLMVDGTKGKLLTNLPVRVSGVEGREFSYSTECCVSKWRVFLRDKRRRYLIGYTTPKQADEAPELRQFLLSLRFYQ